ncbi:hypothetical protein HGRIS_006342 [Hohenbuehelia grisea]|uniref:DUF862-domain-containing protein n=1 Tax=Hohenbuehelia grisea TaxID=104357 RepID=A0ABR3JZW1_9AGAR
MGETSLDEGTFNEYLDEMRDHYTADKYHLLEFNCNSFTNDCIGFLTGGSIPGYIKDLPTDFLSTPFGAALRPTIDAMYRRPTPGPIPSQAPAAASPDLASSLLQAVAARAQSDISTVSPGAGLGATQTLAAPIHPSTNPASFNSLLKSHRAVVAFFTSATCPPCRMIEPTFERLAEEKGLTSSGHGRGAAFTKIDLGVGMSGSIAQEWGVRATPTFIFYLDGKKTSEMKGADTNELRTQVDLLLFQAFPPHPHTSISTPAIKAISLDPILFTQVPPLDTVLNKQNSFIDACTPWSAGESQAQAKVVLTSKVVPFLKARFAANKSATTDPVAKANSATLVSWAQTTSTLTQVLPVESIFPLVDMWRLAVLDQDVGQFLATLASSAKEQHPIFAFTAKAQAALNDGSAAAKSRGYILTVLRLLANAFCSKSLALLLLSDGLRGGMTSVAVASLLHQDASVRTAAASLAFNAAAYLQKERVQKVQSGSLLDGESENEDWEVEMVSAIVEALDREKENEEVVHRLAASLAFLVRLSPFYEGQLLSLLDVLQAKATLKSKLAQGGCGPKGVTKKDVRALVDEVAAKLCS